MNIVEPTWLSTKVNAQNIAELVKAINEMTETIATFNGAVNMTALPTSDPGVAGQLYKDSSGNVKVSG